MICSHFFSVELSNSEKSKSSSEDKNTSTSTCGSDKDDDNKYLKLANHAAELNLDISTTSTISIDHLFHKYRVLSWLKTDLCVCGATGREKFIFLGSTFKSGRISDVIYHSYNLFRY
jgi:hypothetical protein